MVLNFLKDPFSEGERAGAQAHPWSLPLHMPTNAYAPMLTKIRFPLAVMYKQIYYSRS